MCQVAAERRIFCRGFQRWHDSEFHDRWRAILGESTHLTRPQMEELANVWQLTEQIRTRVGLACDAQAMCHGACRGWDEFSNETLGRYCNEILGTKRGRADYDENASVEANGLRRDWL